MKLLHSKCEELQDPDVFLNNKQKVLKEVFADIQSIGSWPVSEENWDKSKFNLNDMLSNLARLGKTSFGFFDIYTPSEPFLEISPLGEQSEPSDDFKKIIAQVLIGNGFKPDDNIISKDFDYYKLFKEELSKHPFEEGVDAVEFSELESRVPSVDFTRIIDNLIHKNRKSLAEKIKDKIITYNFSLFFDEKRNLEKILKSTPERTLANFLIFQHLESSLYALSIDEQIIERRECVKTVIKYLPRASLRVFVRNHFDKENLKIASEMIEETKTNFIEIIQDSTWLHEETKKNAILKVEKMKTLVGYPEEYEKPGALDMSFETLNLSPSDTYYTIVKKINRFTAEQTIEYVALEIPSDPNLSLIETNAFYISTDNFLIILAPFLDDPLFDSTYPKYAKIAGAGNTFSHEIGHGFDPDGRKRDEDGDVRDWWKPEDSAEYEKRVQCLVDQYNEYNDPDFGKNLNGSITIHEMVADGLGVGTSWRAFKKLDLSKEQRIVGFDDYSIEKLYFRIATLDFCAPRDTSSLDVVMERVHPTDSFRVNGVFSNMKSFAGAFNCPVGSPMNPKKKCELF